MTWLCFNDDEKLPVIAVRRLSEAPGLPLGLQQGEDVALTHRPLHVPDNLPGALSNELNFYLHINYNDFCPCLEEKGQWRTQALLCGSLPCCRIAY